MKHRAELDRIRGIAVTMVLIGHLHVFGLQPKIAADIGPFGVTVFFALSGYLITSILLREWERHRRVNLLGFYQRRARRLFPALGLLLLAVAATAFVDGPALLPHLLPVIFYVGNYFRTPEALGHTWSLAVEEQFYITWPVLLWFSLSRLGRRRTAYLAVGVLAALAIWDLHVSMVDVGRMAGSTDTNAIKLTAGCVFALLPPIRVNTVVVAAALLGVLVLCFASPPDGAHDWVVAEPVVAVLTAFVLSSVQLTTIVGRLLAMKPLTHVGKISYGIYLWHIPILFYIAPALQGGWYSSAPSYVRGIILSLIIWVTAILSYELLERHFTRQPSLLVSPA